MDPHISDLMGVLAGVKPVLYTDIARQDEDYLKELCSNLGLLYLKPETGRGKHFHFRSDKFMALIGRSLAQLKAAAKSWREMGAESAFIDWGCLLGYPECCVRRYRPWTDPQRARNAKKSFINEIFENSRPGPLPFLLNNIFNFFSMPYKDGPGTDIELYNRIVRLNRPGGPLPSLNVVTWHPCSYDCAESLRRAALTYAMTRRCLPGWAEMLAERLSRPVLFIEKYKFLVFAKATAAAAGRGEIKIKHAGLAGPVSLLGPETLKKAAAGKTLLVNARGVFTPAKELLTGPGMSGYPIYLDFGKEVRAC